LTVVRLAKGSDRDAIWAIFHEVVAAGDTYPYPPETGREEGLRLWLEVPRATYVAEVDGVVLGTYYIKSNQVGLGDHVCNCGYMVAGRARGQGLGRAMCKHSMDEARRLGYRAMQYNLVVATNEGAVALWQKMGFEIVGTLPGAFRHATLGLVDAHVMFKSL
jgi:L-amino acid N-acyltransferase YncA